MRAINNGHGKTPGRGIGTGVSWINGEVGNQP